MKKKIRDLTIQEILDIHDDEDFEGCDSCPFADTPLCGGIIHNKHLGEFYNKEVEIKEMKDLEQIDKNNPSEALEKIANTDICNVYASSILDYCQLEYETIKQALIKAQKQDKILETLKRPMLFSERKRLGEEFIEWAKENNVLQNDLTSIITWCFCFKMKEWLENGKNV